MSSLHLFKQAATPGEVLDHPRHSHHVALEFDDLESRQLLATLLPATAETAVQPTTTAASNGPGPVGSTSSPETTIGNAATPGTSSSVVTQATGDVGSTQAQITLNSVPSNITGATVSLYTTPSGASAGDGLTSLPISALLPSNITGNETPLDNGTPISGTVWITPPPVPPGIFHPGVTASPVFSNEYNQAVVPQGGTPSFIHFGQNGTGAMNGAAVQQPSATGPVGPSITEEVEPVQAPSEESHQPAGPPPMLQQDVTTPQPDARTPSGSPTQGANQSGAPTQSGDQSPGQPSGESGAQSQSSQSATPNQPAGDSNSGNSGATGGPAEAEPGASGGTGGSGGSGGGAAFLIGPSINHSPLDVDGTLELIDAAIPSLALEETADQDAPPEDGHMAALFGAAAIAATGYQMAHRGDRGTKATTVAGPQ